MTDHTRPTFRADINGLRAWAVLAVIFYHFGLPGFPGGFVGVDVFFVISGFLMTGLVVKGLERDTFSLMGFYMARGRRIVPALAVLCAVLLMLGWWILLPPDYKMLGSHTAYALAFLSNVEFWQEAGYFDGASHEKWLLHTWSLSVEWQFYLILPLVLMAVWRIKPGRKAQTWAISLGLAVSLAASVWVTVSNPSAAFYLLHTRAWEMLGGGLVYLLATKPMLTGTQRRWLESAGLLLIVLAFTIFNKDSSWPGWRAGLPVAAAMLVLLANRNSPWTASALPQWLGDRSYSLYLWHWPLYVALVYMSLDDNPWAIAVALLLTALLGHLSYVWVENTSRRWLEKPRMSVAAGGLALAVVAVVAPAAAIWKSQGIAGRFAPGIELAAAEAKNYNPRRDECHPSKGLNFPSCLYGGSQLAVVVAGDSHADALVPALVHAINRREFGVMEWTYSACTFVFGSKKEPTAQAFLGGDNYKCSEFIASAKSRLNDLPNTIPIILINRYAAAALGANENNTGTNIPVLIFSREFAIATPQYLTEFAEHITQTACQLAKQRTVYMVRPIPEMGFDIPKTLSRRMIFGLNNDLSISIESYWERNAWVWAAQDAARDQCGIKILDPTAYLCHDGRCWGSTNGLPLYTDDDHLGKAGNKLLEPMFAQVFNAL
ncbi:acyltransferase family protein [Rhodoferax antarcticus]|uniref:Putative acyltransferase n=1 Tax=Rhodoferax antarcticus ANT.BR TaxID=1111071 RepID=A0A1Q8YGW5_9BURK|nr:acyltransferase family protein [Rhodoferax antarcticus]APW45089.1 hypothetical protein RA876_00395 [Rhodoferax antarcticus]OLP07308.1 putative acyltransferase [Rhodoferax antarcticus ANT.BR]